MIHILLSSYFENDQKVGYFHFSSKKGGFEDSLVALSCLNREFYAKEEGECFKNRHLSIDKKHFDALFLGVEKLG